MKNSKNIETGNNNIPYNSNFTTFTESEEMDILGSRKIKPRGKNNSYKDRSWIAYSEFKKTLYNTNKTELAKRKAPVTLAELIANSNKLIAAENKLKAEAKSKKTEVVKFAGWIGDTKIFEILPHYYYNLGTTIK